MEVRDVWGGVSQKVDILMLMVLEIFTDWMIKISDFGGRGVACPILFVAGGEKYLRFLYTRRW